MNCTGANVIVQMWCHVFCQGVIAHVPYMMVTCIDCNNSICQLTFSCAVISVMTPVKPQQTCQIVKNVVSVSAMQSLAKQLHSEDVEVRAAAGEAIALLYHSCGISDLDAFLENDQCDESPPASPVKHSQSPNSLRSAPVSAQRPQWQHDSSDSSALHGQGNNPHGDAADSTTHSSSASREPSSEQAHLRNGAKAAVPDSAESESDPQARQLTQDSSQLKAAELHDSGSLDDTRSNHHKQDQAQHQSSAQQHAHNAQHAQQHPIDISHHGSADLQLQPSQAEDITAIRSISHANAQQASSSQPAKIQDTASEGITSNQDQELTKGGRLTNSRASSQNPWQKAQNPQRKAEAITNGLDDVVGRMRELATNRGDKSRRSKRDRVSMKSTFRQLCNVVEV